MSALRLALPSEGALYEGTEGFMRSCGLTVRRASSRRYTAEIPSLPGIEALYQRQTDITPEVDTASADVGIAGLDRYYESRREGGDTLLVMDNLGYGVSRLKIAVPDSWLDVTSVADLADLALEFREKGREFRIATKYPRLVGRFLTERGVNYYTLVYASGGLEAAPVMGYADMIADIVDTGTTLRENRLRPLADGTVVESQAALVANGRQLASDPEKLRVLREMLERIEASLRARDFQRITANIQGESARDVARLVMSERRYGGLQGPSVSDVYSDDGKRWFAAQVVVARKDLIAAVDHFRRLGGSGITVNEASYVFRKDCEAYERLIENLAPFMADAMHAAARQARPAARGVRRSRKA
ncbi:MAG: ATP phosphoribosyltransferase [Dehalococcoidia bacterium]|nr:ATP phosphoribosyltransferase [Dehalococcoidia bacterium]